MKEEPRGCSENILESASGTPRAPPRAVMPLPPLESASASETWMQIMDIIMHGNMNHCWNQITAQVHHLEGYEDTYLAPSHHYRRSILCRVEEFGEKFNEGRLRARQERIISHAIKDGIMWDNDPRLSRSLQTVREKNQRDVNMKLGRG